MPERSDEEMVLRLVKQTKLLIATNDEIPMETKLQSQAMLNVKKLCTKQFYKSHLLCTDLFFWIGFVYQNWMDFRVKIYILYMKRLHI